MSGEKTMIDAMILVCQVMEASLANGVDIVVVLEVVVVVAEQGMWDIIPMLATKGRASYLGERSIGHQDPGATSSAMLFRCAADLLGK
jgi:dihydroxyacetone kinase-like protein